MPEPYTNLRELEARIARTAFYHCQLSSVRDDLRKTLLAGEPLNARRPELLQRYEEVTRVCNNLYDELRALTERLPEMPPSPLIRNA